MHLAAVSRLRNGEHTLHRLFFAPVMVCVAFEAARLGGFLAGMVAPFAGLNAGEEDVGGLPTLRRADMALDTF